MRCVRGPLTRSCRVGPYTEDVQTLGPTATVHQHDTTAAPDTTMAAARHLADVARALADMRGFATAISSTQLMDASEEAAVRKLLPTLAATYGLAYTIRSDGASVTVRFERRAA